MQTSEWAGQFASASDVDPVVSAYGRGFTCSYLLDMGSSRALVEMVDGRVHRITPDPGPLESYDFALRACAATWRDMAQTVPAPGCQGIFAASATRDMRIEGDIAVLMRNLGGITRQIELLRQVGLPQ